MKTKIYISGKITGLPRCEYMMNFYKAKRNIFFLDDFYLQYYKVDIINPTHLKPFLGIKKWWAYMIVDLYHLKRCTHIAIQKNWTESKGSTIEYFFAKFIFKLQIIFL